MEETPPTEYIHYVKRLKNNTDHWSSRRLPSVNADSVADTDDWIVVVIHSM